MNCPKCGVPNSGSAKFCQECGGSLGTASGIATGLQTPPVGPDAAGTGNAGVASGPDAATVATGIERRTPRKGAPAGATATSIAGIGSASRAESALEWASPGGTGAGVAAPAALEPGALVADRYEIIKSLGEGGMGAVFKARDLELDRIVALKVIRPELAGQPAILARFKRELITARQVTHTNVIRIFDLGAAGPLRFITMEFVEGQDLRSLLDETRKVSPERAVEIVRKICLALEAAHGAGVIHRDLKPNNIMLDAQGKVLVMDFGIALSADTPGLTQTGALVGTPEYMSPEQAKGATLDARSDLFSLGIILYEMLTGRVPFRAATPLGTLWKRTQEQAVPPSAVEPSVPKWLNNITVKCLQTDPALRYQSATEVLHDLDEQVAPKTKPPRAGPGRKALVAGVLAAAVLALGGFFLRGWLVSRGPAGGVGAGAGAEVSLAILPFRNASGDDSMNWLGPSIPEMLRTEVGQSSHVRTVPPDRVSQILKDLRILPDATLDQATLQRLAEFTNAGTLVEGQYVRTGDQIRIDATVQDMKRQRSSSLKVEAASQRELLGAIAELARRIQENLSLAPDLVQELQGKSFSPSSKSIEALKSFNEGLEMVRQGNHLAALKRFEASTKEDPSFALAWSRLGQTQHVTGHDKEADEASGRAVTLVEKLPAPERYLILATHARLTNDLDKAIESYGNLVEASPNDPQVRFDLAGLYEEKGEFDKARQEYARVLQLDPKYFDALFAAGRVEIKRGSPDSSLDFLNRALTLAVQLGNQEGKGAIQNAIGIAYKNMGKFEDALQYYRDALATRKQIGDRRGEAASLSEMAQVQADLGKPDQSLSTHREALEMRRAIGDEHGIGNSLIDIGNTYQDLGRYDEALKAYKESLDIQTRLGDESTQGDCLNNIGNVYFTRAQYDLAQTYYQQALAIRQKSGAPVQVAYATFGLAEALARVGQLDRAETHYLKALELWRAAGDKRGPAFFSYGMGSLFEQRGRYGASLDARQEALKTFQGVGEQGPWIAQSTADLGRAQALVGNDAEAKKNLEEGLRLAREVGKGDLIAQALGDEGDRLFYAGDFAAARAQFEQASAAAAKSSDRYVGLLARLNLAKADVVVAGRAQQAVGTLKALRKELTEVGLRTLAGWCSLALGEAMLKAGDPAGASRTLSGLLESGDTAALKGLSARCHFLLARALEGSGRKAEAVAHDRQAVGLLEEIRKDARSDAILQRADLKPIAAAGRR